jgi:hypothetical protein
MRGAAWPLPDRTAIVLLRFIELPHTHSLDEVVLPATTAAPRSICEVYRTVVDFSKR